MQAFDRQVYFCAEFQDPALYLILHIVTVKVLNGGTAHDGTISIPLPCELAHDGTISIPLPCELAHDGTISIPLPCELAHDGTISIPLPCELHIGFADNCNMIGL
jgi:hypothetical protein